MREMMNTRDDETRTKVQRIGYDIRLHDENIACEDAAKRRIGYDEELRNSENLVDASERIEIKQSIRVTDLRGIMHRNLS